ncbi:g3938 [Coccomyxa elongata]
MSPAPQPEPASTSSSSHPATATSEDAIGPRRIRRALRFFRKGAAKISAYSACNQEAASVSGRPAGRNWIVDALRRNVETHPHWPVYRYLDAQGSVTDMITCYGAYHAATSVAAYLLGPCGLQPGDRVVLVYPPGLEFVKAMWGCLFARIVAVPVCPPDPTRLQHTLPHFNRIVEDCGAVAILTDRTFHMVKQATRMTGMLKSMMGKQPQWPSLPWHVTDAAAALPADHAKYAHGEHTRLDVRRQESFMPTDPPEDPNCVAYLQYTSGSTGEPKGVMITHGNLYQHNEAGWGVFFKAEAGEVAARNGVSGTHMLLWLPHFHDFCLTVGVLGCGMKGYPLVLMSPLHFIAKPTRWLDFMSRYKTSHTVGPDFAFGLLSRKTTEQQRRQWDLSNLQFVMSGAEPIRPETMAAFFVAFAPCGLKPSVFCSAYGLAEHVCGATTWGTNQLTVDRRSLEAAGRVRPAAGAAEARVLFSCGTPMAGVSLRIVHPDSCSACEDGTVGEIWLSSPCVTAGYFNKPDLNAQVFQALVAGEEAGRKTWLRTGDMGFVWRGELYVTGRLKDMMIVRGRNIYPNDIEDCLRAAHHPLIRPGGLAAFPVDVTVTSEGMAVEEEGLTIMAEVTRGAKPNQQDIDELISFIRTTVMAHHAVGCHAVVIARPGAIKKTTSGKVQRRACRAAFMGGDYTQANTLVLACSFGAASEGARKAANALAKGSPMRSCDSDQSTASVVSMSESGSDSASDGGREVYLGSASSRETSEPGAEAPTSSAHLLAEQLLALPEEQQLETLQAYMLAAAAEAAGIDELDPDQPLLELGLDSLRAAEFAVQIEEHLNLAVPLTVVFEYPTIRQLAGHILYLLNTPETHPIGAQPEPDTGASLAELADAAAAAADGPGDAPSLLLSLADKAAGVVCSPAQMYFVSLQQLASAGADANVPGGLRLRGKVDQVALQRALQAVMCRHDALRTRFLTRPDGAVVQVVAAPDEAVVSFVMEDAAALPQGSYIPNCSIPEDVAEGLPEAVLARVQREAGTPFDLAAGPLVRTLLIQLAPEDCLLLLVMHHTVSDGWSFKVMLDELSEAYSALRLGKAHVLPLVRLQYPDFAAWHARRSQSPAILRQVEFWRGELAGVGPQLLPTDYPRADKACSRCGWLGLSMDEELVTTIEAFAARAGSTVFMVLLAALQLLLAARSGRDDVVVGSPFAGRMHPATRAMVGCCVSTLPLRARIAAADTVGDFMARVRAAALGAYQNADTGLHTVMAALGRTHNEPLFQVELNLLEAEAQFGIAMDGLAVEAFEVSPGTAMDDFYLVLGHAGRRIAGRLEYNAELFSPATAQRFASDWQVILEDMARGGKEARITELLAKVTTDGNTPVAPATPEKLKE